MPWLSWWICCCRELSQCAYVVNIIFRVKPSRAQNDQNAPVVCDILRGTFIANPVFFSGASGLQRQNCGTSKSKRKVKGRKNQWSLLIRRGWPRYWCVRRFHITWLIIKHGLLTTTRLQFNRKPHAITHLIIWWGCETLLINSGHQGVCIFRS